MITYSAKILLSTWILSTIVLFVGVLTNIASVSIIWISANLILIIGAVITLIVAMKEV